jgi:aminoglycoside 3-N-acetyltransferase
MRTGGGASRYEYGTEDLVRALRGAGLRAGDLAISHVGVGMLGLPREDRTAEAAHRSIVDAYTEVLGPSGTWVVPTYSYTLTRAGEVYDPATTPSEVGAFSEHVRSLPGFVRSRDPIFSVVARGPLAGTLLEDLPHDCFGPDSVYGRLLAHGGRIANAGVGFRYATYIHFCERTIGVPYRYDKAFTGPVRDISGDTHDETWTYHVRALDDPAGLPDLRRLEALARSCGAVGSAPVGIGEITVVDAGDMLALAREGVAADGWFLARGGAEDYDGPPPVPRTGD